MTIAQEQLLSLLSSVLFGESSDTEVEQEVLEEAIAQAVTSLICSNGIVLGQNIRVVYAHAELTKILNGIPFTTFKGYAAAFYYPDPIKRPMGDVDFITTPEYYDDTVQRLLSDGWKISGGSHERHKAFCKGKVLLELHHEIKGIPNGADGIKTSSTKAERKVRALFDDLIPTAITVETQQGPVIIPDEFHHGLIMLLHIAGHMINDGGIGLRHLCDWAVYVNRVNLEQYRSKLEGIGIWTFACQLTAVCSKYIGLPEQYWTGNWPDEFLDELMNEILSAGNFGKKEAGRAGAAVLERTSFAEMTRKRYPAANNSFLLPVFIIIYVARYICLVVLCKRRFIKPSTVLGAKARIKLFEKFRLFEECS